MKTIKLIEKKQERLCMLYLQGSISKKELRELIQSYAQLVCRMYG